MTRKFGETGLGLALSRRLAQLLGGQLSLSESQIGMGSTFKIQIKNDLAAAGKRSIEKSRVVDGVPSAANKNLSGISVLLVEDSADNRDLISILLKQKGAKVDLAENGLAGFDKAIAGNYDLVLMDVQMPVLDGYSAAQRLREAGYKKPIIALTAHTMSEVREKCLDVGCTDYLPKPIYSQDLIQMISKYAGK